jgi:hypothetical protein
LYTEEILIDKGRNFANFLICNKESLNSEFGSPLARDNSSSIKRIVAAYMPGEEKLENRESWPRQHFWLRENAPRLISILKAEIARFDDQPGESPQN